MRESARSGARNAAHREARRAFQTRGRAAAAPAGEAFLLSTARQPPTHYR